ncbi:hypothetical protein Hoch_2266 [Haliangium ochraceum DSM 14365]|uniref:Uncharacterized protein n=2 Tax=Haliangium ochraceum TaxID=80816 RepID=D0LHY0_HALO1|nr:hypothetical protein Hoch_2266 [Haliangium ochraceum DSM 14365]
MPHAANTERDPRPMTHHDAAGCAWRPIAARGFLVFAAFCPSLGCAAQTEETPQNSGFGPAIEARLAALEASAPWFADPAGSWRWHMASDAEGVRRVEIEDWIIESTGTALEGTLVRSVEFLSTDGRPFACNQMLRYRQRTRYELLGYMEEGGFVLDERAPEFEPSPCEPGERPLLRYRGRVVGTSLHLESLIGGQTLWQRPHAVDSATIESHGFRTNVQNSLPMPPSAGGGTDNGEGGNEDETQSHTDTGDITGHWQWQGRSIRPDTGELSIAREEWRVEEGESGELAGIFSRTTTILHTNGLVYPCAGDTFFQYRDEYRIGGRRQGEDLEIVELSLSPAPHPCTAHQTRGLDSATARHVGEYLELRWRGGRRQVLHRAPRLPVEAPNRRR